MAGFLYTRHNEYLPVASVDSKERVMYHLRNAFSVFSRCPLDWICYAYGVGGYSKGRLYEVVQPVLLAPQG